MYIGLIAIGLFLVVITPMSIRAGKKSASWPSVTGTVLSSEVEEKISADAEDGVSRTYYPRIRYEYLIGENKYQGSKYKLLESSMSKRKAEEFAAMFLPGNKVNVYYNPKKPQESVLQTGTQNFLYVFLFLGIGMILAGIYYCMQS